MPAKKSKKINCKNSIKKQSNKKRSSKKQSRKKRSKSKIFLKKGGMDEEIAPTFSVGDSVIIINPDSEINKPKLNNDNKYKITEQNVRDVRLVINTPGIVVKTQETIINGISCYKYYVIPSSMQKDNAELQKIINLDKSDDKTGLDAIVPIYLKGNLKAI